MYQSVLFFFYILSSTNKWPYTKLRNIHSIAHKKYTALIFLKFSFNLKTSGIFFLIKH